MTIDSADPAEHAFRSPAAPNAFVQLREGNPFTWTNAVCSGQQAVAQCLTVSANAPRINAYRFIFLKTYLKHESSPLLTSAGAGLSASASQPSPVAAAFRDTVW